MDKHRKLFDKLAQAIGYLARISGKDVKRIICEHLLPRLLGQPPEWSRPAGGYNIGLGAIFNAGAFCVFYGTDPQSGEVQALLHLRKELTSDGEHQYGAPGGYTTFAEQAFDGMLREGVEEICDENKEPIIDMDIRKLVHLFDGHNLDKDPPVHYLAYAYQLNADDMQKLRAYIARLENEPGFRERITEISKGKSFGVELRPLSEIVALEAGRFNHHRQHAAFKEVARRLSEISPPSSPLGHTLGDMHEDVHPDSFRQRYQKSRAPGGPGKPTRP